MMIILIIPYHPFLCAGGVRGNLVLSGYRMD